MIYVRNSFILHICAAILIIAGNTSTASASLPIELEVAMEVGVPITAPQEWAERLGKLGLLRVQLRSARGGDSAKVNLDDWEKTKRIQVVAILSSRGELVLPGKRFGAGDIARLKAYLESLPQRAAEGDEDRGRFGLTEAQFHQVFEEFSRPVGFSTSDKSTADLLNQLERRISVPVAREPGARAPLNNSEPLPAELQELTTGTALAFAVRREGLAIYPEKPVGKPLRLVVAPYERERDGWPVGWKAEASPRQIAPHLFESLSFEIDGFTLGSALEALQPRIRIPVVRDEWILAQKDIRPEEIEVSLPRRKTFLKGALDRLLSQGRLTGEIRVDEAGTAFLWITQFGADSRPAGN